MAISKETLEELSDLGPWKFGIAAIDKKGRVLHFVGYWKPLTKKDFKLLDEELQTDPEFDMIGEEYTLIEAPQYLVDTYNKEFFGLH